MFFLFDDVTGSIGHFTTQQFTVSYLVCGRKQMILQNEAEQNVCISVSTYGLS